VHRTLDLVFGGVRATQILLVAAALSAAAAVLFVGRDQWTWLFHDRSEHIRETTAETLDSIEGIDASNGRLYRISPDNGSEVSYTATERLAGQEEQTRGTTSTVAGDIAVNLDDPTASVVGEIVVNVEMLRSDSRLRDIRLRHDYLESGHFPFARFVVSEIDGLPDAVVDDETYQIVLTGALTIRDITSEAVFSGVVRANEDKLHADVAATILSSTFGVGPINVARLAQTDDEVLLRFNLVADRVEFGAATTADVNTELPEFVATGGGSFSGDVQPVIEANCVSCHRSGGPGWDTIAFDRASQVAEIASDIAMVTESRFMPPWLPGGESPAFEHEWRLSEEEIDAIVAWAEVGGPLDIDPDTTLQATAETLRSLRGDQVIGPRDGFYVGALDEKFEPILKDDYRCQVHEVADPEQDGTWISGYQFRPDQTRVVHHSIIYLAPSTAMDEINRKSGADGRPGWTCFGQSNLQSEGVVSIGGWAPGRQPILYPEGYGLFLPAGYVLVNQIHYHFDHDAPPDASEIVLQEATAEQAASMISIRGSSYLTPAEVPCTPAEQAVADQREASIEGYRNLCRRSEVIAEVGEKYGGIAPFIPDFLIGQCGGTVDDYNDLDGTIGHSSCDLKARNPGTIYTVLGHMHEFGHAYRMTLNPDTAEEMVLLDIPDWDFEWQLAYDLVDDVRIDTDDTVRFECWWDRTRQFMPEPRYITWNEGTVDEMCFSSISVLPDR